MKNFITLADVKLNNIYTYIIASAPTTTEKEPLYVNGETWLDSVTGLSYILTNQITGVWSPMELDTDVKILAQGDNTFLTVLRYLCNPFIVDRNGLYEDIETDFPDNFIRQEKFQLAFTESAYSNFTFAAAGKTITAATDLWGDLTNSFAAGDCILIAGSRRNNGYYTIDTVTTTVITVLETVVDGSANCFIFLADVPNALINIVAQMVWYDIYRKKVVSGLKSERIGTYSWTKDDSSNTLNYPDDIISGLSVYEIECIGGISVFVD